MDSRRLWIVLAIAVSVFFIVLGAFVFLAAPSEMEAQAVSGGVGAVAAASSSDSDFPFWIFIAIMPAIFVPIIAARQQTATEKPKNDDKPKRDYMLGPDGELMEVVDEQEEDEINHLQM